MAITQGNWKFYATKAGGFVYYDVETDDPQLLDDAMICSIYSENAEDDARLIAAAPKLMEAAEVLANLDLSLTLESKPDDYPLYSLNDSFITVGDVRNARVTVASAKGKGGE